MPTTPYTTGTPVTGQKFYNRSEIIKDLMQFNDTSYILNGLRRIGKSSVLRQLEIKLCDVPGIAPVYFSLDWHENAVDMGQELRREILNQIEKNNWNNDFELGLETPIDEVVQYWISYCQKHKLRSFLLIDECEQLNSLDLRTIINLNNIFLENTAILKVIIAGTRHFFKDTREAFISFSEFFQKKYIGHFEFPYVESLVKHSLEEDHHIEVPAETLNKIVEYCGGHPYLIQLFCTRLYQTETGKMKEVNETAFAIDNSLSNFFKLDYDTLTETQQNILSYISSKGKAMVTRAEIRETLKLNDVLLRSALSEMLELGIVKTDSITGNYAIAYAFFSDWICANIPIPDILVDDKQAVSHPGIDHTGSKLNIVTLFASSTLDNFLKFRSTCLRNLADNNLITHWDIEQLKGGDEIESIYNQKIHEADIIIGFISPDYVSKEDEVYQKHTMALGLGKIFVPIIAITGYYDLFSDIKNMIQLPKNGSEVKPLDQWDNLNEAWKHLTEEIHDLILAKRQHLNR